jgi:hypothetical protein
MNILFRAYFCQKNYRQKLGKNLYWSGFGSGHFQKSDPEPDPDPVKKSSGSATLVYSTVH